MRGLKVWKRDSGGGLILASYHSPNNLCWSWVLAFRRFRADEGRWWPLFWRRNTNTDRRWGARIPPFGFLDWTRQTNVMPYRDLYYRARDERDRLESEIGRIARRASPPRSPFKPTIIEGGPSLH